MRHRVPDVACMMSALMELQGQSTVTLTWDSLSDSAKQAIVDEANSSGALGCGAGYTCTMSDAESLADSLR